MIFEGVKVKNYLRMWNYRSVEESKRQKQQRLLLTVSLAGSLAYKATTV